MRVDERQIEPMGRNGKSDPDFVIYPRSGAFAEYGVIELKRPDSRILVKPRQGIVTLSADARTAVTQAQVYGEQLGRKLALDERSIFLGNRQVLFVVMGLSAELSDRLGREILDGQVAGLLPANCRLIPYDTLHRAFESSLPPRFITLVPDFGERAALSSVPTNLYSWWLFQMHTVALDYWRDVAVEVHRSAPDIDPESFSRGRFEWARGQLDTEMDSLRSFAADIVRLTRSLRFADETVGSHPTVTKFLSAADAIVADRVNISSRQLDLLRGAVAEARQGAVVYLRIGDPDVDHLERLGYLKFDNIDAGESNYHVHPILNFWRGTS
jgi:hypothetical protein